MPRFVLLVAGVILLVSCASNPNSRIDTGGTDRTSARLDPSVPILVTMATDGHDNGETYAGSGNAVVRRIDASLSRYARIVDVSPKEYHSMDELVPTIAENNYGYIVVPKILTWTPGQKKWGGRSAEVIVKMTVLEASTGHKIASTILIGRNPAVNISPFTWFSTQTDDPGKLLGDPLDDYVDYFYECSACAYLW